MANSKASFNFLLRVGQRPVATMLFTPYPVCLFPGKALGHYCRVVPEAVDLAHSLRVNWFGNPTLCPFVYRNHHGATKAQIMLQCCRRPVNQPVVCPSTHMPCQLCTLSDSTSTEWAETGVHMLASILLPGYLACLLSLGYQTS